MFVFCDIRPQGIYTDNVAHKRLAFFLLMQIEEEAFLLIPHFAEHIVLYLFSQCSKLISIAISQLITQPVEPLRIQIQIN